MTPIEKTLLSACESAEDFINGLENYSDEARAVHNELREAIKEATEEKPEITEDEEKAILALYDKWEHVSRAKIEKLN